YRSAEILCRLGGRPLDVGGVPIPPYYDPRYQCTMELLRFDSRAPCEKFEGHIRELERRLSDVAVVSRPYWPIMRRQRKEIVPLDAMIASRACASSAQTVSLSH